MAEKAAYPCVKFEMALNAGFQECGTCGWAKDQHKPMVRKKLKKAAEKNGLKSAVVGGKKEIQKEAEPCRNYNRNLQAVEYDTCDCGWSLEEHQKADAERARLAQEEEERRQAAANTKNFRELAIEQGVACSKFEVDVNNTVGGYGVCLCGKTREEHFEFKTDGKQYEQVKEGLTEPKPFV